MPPEFDHVKITYQSVVEGEPDESSFLLPAVISRRPRIDVEQTETMIGHHLQDMAVAANEQIDPLLGEQ